MVDRFVAEPNGGLIAMQETAEARTNMYAFLASVYLHPPQMELIGHLANQDSLDQLSALTGEQAVEELRDFAAADRAENELEPLRQEFMDLFAVPTGRYTTPFEDVYRWHTATGGGEQGPLLGQWAIAVRRMYRAAGAEMDMNCKELPTHIGVELSFMRFLCEAEATAVANVESDKSESCGQERANQNSASRYRDLQTRFLRDHLDQWFPQLHRTILENGRSHYFKGLAQVTKAFLLCDLAYLNDQSGNPTEGRHF